MLTTSPDRVVRDREKVLIWCQLPAVTILLYAVFKLLKIEVVTITAFQKAEERERDRIIQSFNEDDTKAMVCIMTYAIGSTGLNMQKRCRRVHVIESAQASSGVPSAQSLVLLAHDAPGDIDGLIIMGFDPFESSMKDIGTADTYICPVQTTSVFTRGTLGYRLPL